MDTPNATPLSEADLDAVAGGRGTFEITGSPPIRFPIEIVDDDPFPTCFPLPMPVSDARL